MRLSILLSLSLFALGACSSESPTSSDGSWLQVELSGALLGESGGTAYFHPGATTSRRGPLSFSILLTPQEIADVESILMYGTPGVIFPERGSYELVANRSEMAAGALPTGIDGFWKGEHAGYTVLNGEMEVLSSSDSVVDGELRLTAGVSSVWNPEIREFVEVDPHQANHQINVVASFHAILDTEPVRQMPLPTE